ncbi:helix-turn-helix domain-containing protein [Brevibacterium aurantiacum]|uniref:helix-turn-helix domain-containing protein n=1 Tax=Brevibacterium aurantiacum TaxID=273384 RepID=UPI0021B4C81A|nr:helix-turn-helix domain-containing protein [Brevibacterium aurantiacum]
MVTDASSRHIACRLNANHHDHACVAFELPVSKSTATDHFRTLGEAGVIRQEYQGTSIMNFLPKDDLEARFPGLLDAVFAAQNIEGGAAFVSV